MQMVASCVGRYMECLIMTPQWHSEQCGYMYTASGLYGHGADLRISVEVEAAMRTHAPRLTSVSGVRSSATPPHAASPFALPASCPLVSLNTGLTKCRGLTQELSPVLVAVSSVWGSNQHLLSRHIFKIHATALAAALAG